MFSPRAALDIQPPPSTGQGSVEAGTVRVRQHVNPLARRWRQPLTLPPDWFATAFADPSLPLIVDVGVAKGRFLLRLAGSQPKFNHLGLEIREPLVHQANRAAATAGVSPNLFYLACNANVALAPVLRDVSPPHALTAVYIQFCDPWFKKRHAKRRMVNDALVQDIFSALTASQGAHPPNEPLRERRVFVQTDVLEVAEEMRSLFDDHDGFERLGTAHGFEEGDNGWLLHNPTGEPTEREIAVRNNNGSVYRALFRLRTVPTVQVNPPTVVN